MRQAPFISLGSLLRPYWGLGHSVSSLIEDIELVDMRSVHVIPELQTDCFPTRLEVDHWANQISRVVVSLPRSFNVHVVA